MAPKPGFGQLETSYVRLLVRRESACVEELWRYLKFWSLESQNQNEVLDGTAYLPWPAYAIIPGSLAISALAALGLAIPKRKWNLLFIIGFNLGLAFCNLVGSGLLSRDYIGKF
jgi:hypothetical protein